MYLLVHEYPRSTSSYSHRILSTNLVRKEGRIKEELPTSSINQTARDRSLDSWLTDRMTRRMTWAKRERGFDNVETRASTCVVLLVR